MKRRLLHLILITVLSLALACTKDKIDIIPDEPQDENPVKDPEKEPDKEPPRDTTVHKLSGEIIGTVKTVDYSTGQPSTTVNSMNNVFDGNFDSYFATFERSNTWVGLDLGEKHVITKVGYSPRKTQEGRVQLAIIEGANSMDFSDALPIGMIREKGQSGVMQYIDISCSRGFRFVRYVGPADARCNLAELEFYGKSVDGDDSKLFQLTNLPTVVINTTNAQPIVTKEVYVTSNVYIVSKDGTELMSAPLSGVKGRGNASWDTFPKKPYKIKFAEKHHVLGSPSSDKKWTLISNYGDKTLMRNILAFEVSRRVGMVYTPFCTPVDVILNGEYKGCYQLCDQVEAGVDRVPAKDGYFIEIDAYAYSEKVFFYSNKGIPVTIKEPDSDKITASQINFIRDYFTQLEIAMFSASYRDVSKGYRKYMDLDSFLRNFIIGEFCGNTDTYWSVNMYKDARNGVLYTGPAWDYDLAFENDNRTYPINELYDFIYAEKGSVAADAVRTMVNRIVKQDAQARARLVEIWDDVRPSLEDLNDYVDETAALLDEAQQLNFKRWNILNSRVHQNPKAYGSYEAEVKVVKDYITGRLTRFDQLVRGQY